MYIPCRKICPCPIPLVFVLNPHYFPSLRGKGGMPTMSSLDAGFLISRQQIFPWPQRHSLPGGFIQVQNRPRLLGEVRSPGKDPTAVAPRPNGVLRQPTPQSRPADLGYDTPMDDLPPQLLHGEGGKGHAHPARQFTGQSLYLHHHRWGKKNRAARREADLEDLPTPTHKTACATC